MVSPVPLTRQPRSTHLSRVRQLFFIAIPAFALLSLWASYEPAASDATAAAAARDSASSLEGNYKNELLAVFAERAVAAEACACSDDQEKNCAIRGQNCCAEIQDGECRTYCC
jgi:hypothetical protein